MNARAQLERLYHGGPAPAPVAPPKPGIKPGERPTERPGTPAPGPGVPDPWRRKTIRPGHEPRPKSRYNDRVHAEAKKFLQLNDLGEFVK